MVQHCGGGSKFPLVHFLADFSRAFGEGSVACGNDFMTALATTKITEDNHFPFVKIASHAAQLTAQKHLVVDGIAKVLSAADVKRLASKKLASAVHEAEEVISAAWLIFEADKSKSQRSLGALGKLMTRTVLHILGKEKNGRDPPFASLTEISSLFAEAMSSSGKKATSKPEPKSPDELHKLADDMATSLTDAKSAASMALKKNTHIEVDGIYVHASADGFWKYVKINEEDEAAHLCLYFLVLSIKQL